MKPTYLIGISIIVTVLIGGGIYSFSNKQVANNSKNSEMKKETPKGSFTLDDVAKHSSADDCWLVIEDKVYEVSSYVSKHPGGKEIIRGCGKDATVLFNTRPDTVRDGTSHSSFARSVLEDFKIGELSE
jgi:cytochrome b involved in lipid metabolism